MIDFRKITVQDKETYQNIFFKEQGRGCEMSFANLFLWGDQKIAFVDGQVVLFSTFSRSFYPYPIGKGDKKAILDKIRQDAKEREIPLEITSVNEQGKEEINNLYPDEFLFETNDGSYDYVYDINDLADLSGKKYHKKRTHLNNFKKACPDYYVQPISKQNLDKICELVKNWYQEKQGDFDYEKQVFERAIQNFEALELEGLALFCGEKILAVTFASRMNADTMDVHFEKALTEIDGTYPAINNEFAKYIRAKYPEIKYLDREEDMGIEGLRKSKQSYYPHHQVIKYKAKLKNS